MLDDITLWIMLNTLILVALLITFIFLFAWAYSEIQHLRAKKDCFYNETKKNKIFGGYKK